MMASRKNAVRISTEACAKISTRLWRVLGIVPVYV